MKKKVNLTFNWIYCEKINGKIADEIIQELVDRTIQKVFTEEKNKLF